MKKNNSLILVFIVALLIVLLFIFMPSIYKWSSKLNNPKVKISNKDEKKETNDTKFDESILDDIVYPDMHVNNYIKDTYYSLDTFTIDKMSNNDILANAFEQVYDGYIKSNQASGCASNGKKIDAKYLTARIKNMLSNKIKYQFTDFNVFNTKYPGLWKYDVSSNSYIYNGNCNNTGSTKYYDIHYMTKYKAKDNNKTIEITSKVAFVKVDNNNYVIYKDSAFTQELDKGIFTDLDTLSKKLSKLSANQYKYIFKQGLCTYEAYCLESGGWING